MLASFLLYAALFLILAIVGFNVVVKCDSANWGIPGMIVGLISSVAFICFVVAGGCGGEFGFNTYREVPTTNFSKALLSDHSAVIIRYCDANYTFTQFNAVYNYNSITNIVICEKRSVLGCQVQFDVKVPSQPYIGE